MNDALDDIRRTQYNQEKDLNKRKVIKGTYYCAMVRISLMEKTRLDNTLSTNEPPSKAYYLKEELKDILYGKYAFVG